MRHILCSLASVACGLASTSEAGAQDFFAKDICAPDEVTLELGDGFPAPGVIELLFPLPDTDGRDPVRWEASNSSICISAEKLASYENSYEIDVDVQDYNALIFVSYDPVGTIYRSRSYFDYSILMCEELSETPRPPKDMRFGKFVWTRSAGIKAIRVSWISDLRQKLENECESY
ncbi:MAG: hypothetical protein R3D99_11610 [Altererythrobacter sp.]